MLGNIYVSWKELYEGEILFYIFIIMGRGKLGVLYWNNLRLIGG